MTSTEAIASEADDHVDPHSSANCTIDFVSSSMKPAPSQKNDHDHRWLETCSTTEDTVRTGRSRSLLLETVFLRVPSVSSVLVLVVRSTTRTAVSDTASTTASAAA